MLPIMLIRDGSNGIDLQIATLTLFLACKPPNVFNPWSEDLFQKLLSNILDLTQDVEGSARNNYTLNDRNEETKKSEIMTNRKVESKDIFQGY